MADVAEREHPIGLFDELVCRGAGTIQLVSGPNPHLVVVGPPELVDHVVVRYRGMRLVIAYRVGPHPIHLMRHISEQVRTIVVTDAISRVGVQGAANLILGESPEHPFTTDSIRLVSSGTGFVSGSVSTSTISVRLRGVGDLDIDGDTDLLDARIAGTGSLDCSDLVCKQARVHISGTGSCRVMVLDDLKATTNGTGRLSYRGTAVLTARGASAGKIEHLE
jgi:putative autotransporter adhesin-like protein